MAKFNWLSVGGGNAANMRRVGNEEECRAGPVTPLEDRVKCPFAKHCKLPSSAGSLLSYPAKEGTTSCERLAVE